MAIFHFIRREDGETANETSAFPVRLSTQFIRFSEAHEDLGD